MPKHSIREVKVIFKLKKTSNGLSMCQSSIGPHGQELNFVYNAH